jgi:hypothetical protein
MPPGLQIEQMCDNDFVNRVELVRKFKKDPNDVEFTQTPYVIGIR